MKKKTMDYDSFIKINSIKRSNSFNVSDESRKKILKKLKTKIIKKNKKEEKVYYNETESIDENMNKEYSTGFSVAPNSNFIFIFDIILIIANLHSFIFIPLKIAKNENLGLENTLTEKIMIYLVDIIYIIDFIICFFKGFYNDDMIIIRNNKQIFFNYLKHNFFMDLIEAIPLNTFIIFFISINNQYFGYTDIKIIFLKLLLFIKPIKIFKLLKKKNNIVLEEFLEKINENYHLETIVIVIFYFVLFFLFFHLFICLHIFFSSQSYPNWQSLVNVTNKNFSIKYITSFYFMFTTITTVGYGDIVCVSFIEFFILFY